MQGVRAWVSTRKILSPLHERLLVPDDTPSGNHSWICETDIYFTHENPSQSLKLADLKRNWSLYKHEQAR